MTGQLLQIFLEVWAKWQERLSGEFACTFKDDGLESEPVDMEGYVPVGLYVGESKVFQVSFLVATTTGGPYSQVMDPGNADAKVYKVGVLVPCYVPLDPTLFAGVRYFKVKLEQVTGGDSLGGVFRVVGRRV